MWEDFKKRDRSLQVFEFMHHVAATKGDIPIWIRHKVHFFPLPPGNKYVVCFVLCDKTGRLNAAFLIYVFFLPKK